MSSGQPFTTELVATGGTGTLELRPAAPRTMRSMRVQVRLPGGQRQQYEALFGHTFDAYDDALERFPAALRIEVEVLQPALARAAAGVQP